MPRRHLPWGRRRLGHVCVDVACIDLNAPRETEYGFGLVVPGEKRVWKLFSLDSSHVVGGGVVHIDTIPVVDPITDPIDYKNVERFYACDRGGLYRYRTNVYQIAQWLISEISITSGGPHYSI